MTPGALLAEVTRRDVATGHEHLESVHTGHLVVVDGDGTVLASLGEPDVELFLRSTVKPLQATSCLELLAGADIELTDAEVAVAWASHRGEPAQVEAVTQLLARSGTAPEALTCPPARPRDEPGAAPRRITHNCSGKHALFALAGAEQGVRGPDLLDPGGPLQRRVIADLGAALGRLSAIGIDGCGAPAVRAPLSGLARAFARVAVDDRYARVRGAGVAHPQQVGGSGRIESALLAEGVVAKPGAEGSYGVGWVADDGSPRGLAVRAADGSARGSAIAVITVLEGAGVVPSATWSPPRPLGGGQPVGHVRAPASVHELAARLSG